MKIWFLLLIWNSNLLLTPKKVFIPKEILLIERPSLKAIIEAAKKFSKLCSGWKGTLISVNLFNLFEFFFLSMIEIV